MESLADRFSELKKNIKDKQEKDQTAKKAFKEALFVVFPGQSVEKFVKNFCLRKGILFLETTNKSFAQEIFLKQGILLREVNKKARYVSEIKVR